MDIFLDLAERGVSVAILTNSLAATDVAAVHAGYARYRKPLLLGGVNLHELRSQADQGSFTLRGSGQASLHTKAFTRDGKTGYIGSLNFDPRSASLNTEMGVVFNSAPLVARMDEIFSDEIRRMMSFELGMDNDNRLLWMTEEQGQPKYTGANPTLPSAVGSSPVSCASCRLNHSCENERRSGCGSHPGLGQLYLHQRIEVLVHAAVEFLVDEGPQHEIIAARLQEPG